MSNKPIDVENQISQLNKGDQFSFLYGFRSTVFVVIKNNNETKELKFHSNNSYKNVTKCDYLKVLNSGFRFIGPGIKKPWYRTIFSKNKFQLPKDKTKSPFEPRNNFDLNFIAELHKHNFDSVRGIPANDNLNLIDWLNNYNYDKR